MNWPRSGGLCAFCSTDREDRSRTTTERQPSYFETEAVRLEGVVASQFRTEEARSIFARERLLSSFFLSKGVPAAVRQSRNTTLLEEGSQFDWLDFKCTYPPLHMHVMKGIPAHPHQPLPASSIEHVWSAATPSSVQSQTKHHVCDILVVSPMHSARLLLP